MFTEAAEGRPDDQEDGTFSGPASRPSRRGHEPFCSPAGLTAEIELVDRVGQTKLTRGVQPAHLAPGNDEIPLAILKDVSRDYPARGHDECPVSAIFPP